MDVGRKVKSTTVSWTRLNSERLMFGVRWCLGNGIPIMHGTYAGVQHI